MVQVRYAQTKQEKLLSQKVPKWGALNTFTGYGATPTNPFGFPMIPGQTPETLSGMPPFGSFFQAPPTPSTTGPLQTGPPGANLFIYNLPESYDDRDLASLFSNFGVVVSTKVQKDKLTGASKGYGFVSFDSVRAAQTAISSMDGFVIGNKKLAVRIKKGDGGEVPNGRQASGYSPY